MGVNQRRPQMQQEFADARPETAADAIWPTEEGRDICPSTRAAVTVPANYQA